MCAIEAGKRGRRVAVLERAERLGKKILISGGGRCNFTNLHCSAENFISANPHFAKSALARYTASDFISLVEKHGIAYHEKTLGQLFCDRSALDILNMLENECRESGVHLFASTAIQEVTHAGEFTVRAVGKEFRAPALAVATGGLSIPKMGATGFGYELARQFGLAIRKTRPGLVPFLFNKEDGLNYNDLSGISAEVTAASENQHFREKMLITHRGLSGPAILQISSYWKKTEPVVIDLAPGHEVLAALLDGGVPRNIAALRSALREFLSHRLADRWLALHGPQFLAEKRQAPKAMTNASLKELERQLHEWTVVPAGTEGYDKAEVTVGGVDTAELSAQTMESRKVPGLFFIGEVVDVTGHLGGFNFQWAWASGASAGRAL